MTHKWPSILPASLFAIAIALPLLAAPADAKTKHRKRVQPAPVADTSQRLGAREPARMIELRPGYWISNYGCASYEGHGRYSRCDSVDGGGM